MSSPEQMRALDDQIALQLKKAQSSFWKIGTVCLIGGALAGGLLVLAARMMTS